MIMITIMIIITIIMIMGCQVDYYKPAQLCWEEQSCCPDYLPLPGFELIEIKFELNCFKILGIFAFVKFAS